MVPQPLQLLALPVLDAAVLFQSLSYAMNILEQKRTIKNKNEPAQIGDALAESNVKAVFDIDLAH